jgi:hypothetical protein
MIDSAKRIAFGVWVGAMLLALCAPYIIYLGAR